MICLHFTEISVEVYKVSLGEGKRSELQSCPDDHIDFYLTRLDDSDTLAELFHSSSTAEQSAVNRSVAGSNPACGDT